MEQNLIFYKIYPIMSMLIEEKEKCYENKRV